MSTTTSSGQSNEIVSVIIAAAQSVAKVFVIGSIGYGAVRLPVQAPLLPPQQVSTVARFCFHTLLLSLIYSTTAVSVNPDSLGQYWFVVVAGFAVIILSYLVATVVGKLLSCVVLLLSWRRRQCDHVIENNNNNKHDFTKTTNYKALRIAATFPNIVALPILIFPSLCEHEIVYSNFVIHDDDTDEQQQQQDCANQANTMIFCYFFAWSLLFWSLGYPQLMSCSDSNYNNVTIGSGNPLLHDEITAPERGDNKIKDSSQSTEQDTAISAADEAHCSTTTTAETSSSTTTTTTANDENKNNSWYRIGFTAIRQTCTSPGFVALVAGIATGCIPPLRDAMFEPAGVLRFLGDAIETLGRASSPLSTMIVAASLATKNEPSSLSNTNRTMEKDCINHSIQNSDQDEFIIPSHEHIGDDDDEQLGSQLQETRTSNGLLLNICTRVKNMIAPTHERLCLLIWFTLSRLILSPAIIVGIVATLHRYNVLNDSISPLAQLVVLVNASLPGALIVVVILLKSTNSSEAANAVTAVYLPTYLLSIVTIAAWTAVGLWISLPS